MMTIHNILQAKGSQAWHVLPRSTVYDAIKLMGEKNVGALLVMEDSRIAGIVSERDYTRKVILKGKSSKETMVEEIMTTEVKTVNDSQSVFECMEIMTSLHIRHLPVMDKGKLAGIISIGDVVKAVISDQQDTIEHLKTYIAGGS